MQNDSLPPVTIEYTPEFKRNVRTLAKKYRHIRSDIQPVLNRLANSVLSVERPKTRPLVGKMMKRESQTSPKGTA